MNWDDVLVGKRDNQQQKFDLKRIRQALDLAYKAVSTQNLSLPAIDLDLIHANVLAKVEAYLSELDSVKIITIEQIQDFVEEVLVENGQYVFAKAYILYRENRKHLRTQVKEQQLYDKILEVETDSGSFVSFDIYKIIKQLETLSRDLSGIQLKMILRELSKNIFSGIKLSELQEAIILSTACFIEKDPDYDVLASRLVVQSVKKQVKTNLKMSSGNSRVEIFKAGIEEGVSHDYYDKRLIDFDLDKLGNELVESRDDLLQFLGSQTLKDRYLLRLQNGNVIETPQTFWMRVAMGIAIDEQAGTEKAIEFYHLISQLYFVPSTPTLFHAGTPRAQLSSCYLNFVDDDLKHIFKAIGDNAQMSKWSGGVGTDWTSVRATGSFIHTTKVDSQGVVPFLKVANDATVAINRSGRRRGAVAAYLETWHLDIEDFLDLRRNTGDERRRTHDMETVNWIPDLFMKRVERDEEWTLFSPSDVPDLHETFGKDFEQRYLNYERQVDEGHLLCFKKVSASQLWKKMLTRLFETGHPWITFKDPCNVRSPQDHVGVIHNSNLCTEITLNNSIEETAVCNLGSINLSRHIKDGRLDVEQLERSVTTAVRMLDNVIDINFYPTPEAKTANTRHRPIGLGMMGVQDYFYKIDLAIDSSKALTEMDVITEYYSYFAIKASHKLAVERGAYSSFKGSKWDRGIFPFDTIALLEEERGEAIDVDRNSRLDWDSLKQLVAQDGMRNSNTMAIAPTATISNIAGCLPCIEPIYKNIYVKANMSGEFTVVNQALVKDLKAIDLWDEQMLERIKHADGSIQHLEVIPSHIREKYKEVFEIDAIDLMRLSAMRGKWIDQSQSHNIFLRGTSGRKIHETYMASWKMGLKTTYYLRSLAASQIEKVTVDRKKYGATQKRTVSAPVASPAPIDETKASASVPAPSVPVVKEEVNTKNTPVENSRSNDFFSADVIESENAIASACSIMDPDCESCQ